MKTLFLITKESSLGLTNWVAMSGSLMAKSSNAFTLGRGDFHQNKETNVFWEWKET